MAKFGEGDKRWIVEDRPDGANVHNWHWNEKDCLPWSKKRLGELLENIVILEGEGGLWVQTTNIESVTGDAYVNIRLQFLSIAPCIRRSALINAVP